MFRKRFSTLVVIAAAVLAAAWPRDSVASDDVMLPFEVRLEGFAFPVFNEDGSVDNVEEATGLATHMGLVAWHSEEHAVPIPGGMLAVKGEFTLTAANGDKVFGCYETVGKIIEFPMARFEGEFTITGGTGRFAGASGSGTIVGDGSLLPPFGIVGSLSGKISQPGP